MMEQQIYLVRHGETEWSRAGRHTGRTDVPLTDDGRRRARAIGAWLAHRPLTAFVSPLGRARDTCELAGYGPSAEVLDDLREWDYGVYEGRTTTEVRAQTPDWSVWTAPIDGGESIEQVAERARRVIARALQAAPHDVALFAHAHVLRILTACWLEMPPLAARHFALDTASISILGYERETHVIRLWNLQPPL